MTITEFLLARIAEDEAAAHDALSEDPDPRRGGQPPWFGGDGPSGYAWVILTPERALAECEAKRLMLDEHQPRVVRPVDDIYDDECQTCHGSEPGEYPCATLRVLVSVYADHPDFREEWRA